MEMNMARSDYRSVGPRFRIPAVAVIALLCAGLALATASECNSITHFPSLVYGVILWGWWGCDCRRPLDARFTQALHSELSPASVALHVFFGSLAGVIHLLLLGATGFIAPEWRAHAAPIAIWTSLLNINRFGMEILTYGFIFGIVGIVQFQIRAQSEAIKSLELQKQLSAAQLRALQMQLEPHFLFNTLNAITTLVELGRQAESRGDAGAPECHS